jgi:hypothetical protein
MHSHWFRWLTLACLVLCIVVAIAVFRSNVSDVISISFVIIGVVGFIVILITTSNWLTYSTQPHNHFPPLVSWIIIVVALVGVIWVFSIHPITPIFDVQDNAVEKLQTGQWTFFFRPSHELFSFTSVDSTLWKDSENRNYYISILLGPEEGVEDSLLTLFSSNTEYHRFLIGRLDTALVGLKISGGVCDIETILQHLSDFKLPYTTVKVDYYLHGQIPLVGRKFL